MNQKTRIMFIDDEPNVLAALKRMLRPRHNDWDMMFVNSGAEALEKMAQTHFDIVVSDIRMPGMDGATLLNRVKADSPTTMRVALSGQVDLNEVIRSIKAVHQYISKPCNAEDLIEKLDGMIISKEILTDKELLELVTNLDSLPVIPEVFRDIEQEMAQKEPSIEKIAAHIAKDIGFMAKTLNLINSPYFGLPATVDSVQKAITMLGLDTIKALVLSTHMFSMYDDKKIPELNFSLLWDHCFRVSNMARLIAECEGMDRATIAQCRMAGLLHDVGKLVLASNFPDIYREILKKAAEPDKLIAEAEKDVFGTTHAEIGAYLMGLWGLSGNLLYGIGHHHDRVTPDNPTSLIVHVADVMDHNFFIINKDYSKRQLEAPLQYLMNDTGKITEWIHYIQDKWDYWATAASDEADVLLWMKKGDR